MKKLPSEIRATSVVVGASGLYWRTLADTAAVADALRKEKFGLVLLDHREATGDPVSVINDLPDLPARTPTILLTEQQFDLETVIQAIRLGVKDVFNPPLDPKALVERVHAILRPTAGINAPLRMEDWTELVMFLAHGEMPATHPPRKANGKSEASSELLTRLALVTSDRDRLTEERNRLRDEAAQARARLSDLEKDSGRLAALQQDLVAARSAQHASVQELAVLQEKLETEQMLGSQARGKGAEQAAQLLKEIEAARRQLDADRAELARERQKFIQQAAASDTAMDERESRLAAAEKARAEAAAQLAAEQEELEATRLMAAQNQQQIDQGLLELQVAADEFKGQQSRVAAEGRKLQAALDQRTAALAEGEKTLAAGRTRLLEGEKTLASGRARLAEAEKGFAAANAKLTEAERGLAAMREQLTQEHRGVETIRSEMLKDRKALEDREAALEEAEMLLKNQTAQLKKEQGRLASERTILAAEKATLDQEAKALGDRAQEFDTKQVQLREQVKHLLRSS